MKKIIYTLIAIAAVSVGCSKSEVMDAPGADTPITFNPYLGKTPVSKAPVANVDTLGAYGFQTYAFIHLPVASGVTVADPEVNFAGDPYLNKVVEYDENGTWGYEGKAYWPTSYYLDFVAYGLNANGTDNYLSEEGGAHKAIRYEVPADILEQRDLVVADPIINQHHGNADKSINLHFNHMLSRVAFTLVTKAANSTPVTITNLKLKGNFYSQGTVDLTAASPVITPDVTVAATTEYDVLDGGTFTHASNADGVYMYNNGMLYELVGVTETDGVKDYSDASYEVKTFADTATKEAAEAAAKMYSEGNFLMIIPSDNPATTDAVETVEASVDVTYFLPGAGYYEMNVPLKKADGTYIQFEGRKAYNFKLKVSTNGIDFSVKVDGWDDTTVPSEEFELL